MTRQTTAHSSSSRDPDEASQVPNPDLPVVGRDDLDFPIDGLGITGYGSRSTAVSAAVRSLDWSVTPLRQPGACIPTIHYQERV